MVRSDKVTIAQGLLAVSAVLLLTAGAAVAWDSQYLDRSDKIDRDAGDAVARNRAIQTIDPLPAHAFNDRINVDGNRLNCAYTKYKSGSAGASGGGAVGGNQTSISINTGSGGAAGGEQSSGGGNGCGTSSGSGNKYDK